MEAYKCNAHIVRYMDVYNVIVKPFFEKDEEKKAEFIKDLSEKIIPEYLDEIEALLVDGKFLLGGD